MLVMMAPKELKNNRCKRILMLPMENQLIGLLILHDPAQESNMLT